MSKLTYKVTDPIGHRAILGLVVLQADETVEPELQAAFSQDGVALYTSRIESEAEVTPDALITMEAKLPASIALFPPSLSFDVIGYACTSGATIIGPARTSELILAHSNAKFATNPLTALIDTCHELKIKNLTFISPYVDEVSAPVRAYLKKNAGINITEFASFDEKHEAKVARIDPQSTLQACLEIGGKGRCDAVFLACTNLRTATILQEAHDRLGIPVFSSNSVLARHMTKLAQI